MTNITDRPWQDRDTLERMYFEEGLTQGEIAERLGCARRTITKWFGRHGLEGKLGKPRKPWVYFTTDLKGYERWQDKCQPSFDDIVRVHRLLAVAEYGFDAVRGMHVHHVNGIPWDNRPDNIELLTPSEHGQHHYEAGDNEGWGPEEGLVAQYGEEAVKNT